MNYSFYAIVFLLCVMVALLANTIRCSSRMPCALPSSRPILSSSQTLIYHYSSKKECFSGFDSGGIIYTKYSGKRILVLGKIVDISLTDNSPSIAVENDTVIFRLLSGQVVPEHPNCSSILLRFDKHGIVEQKSFTKGDIWEITFTQDGELVNLHPH